jgi:hypothetical protein
MKTWSIDPGNQKVEIPGFHKWPVDVPSTGFLP